MKVEGGFRYFVDNKEVVYKDLQKLIRLDMTVHIEGLNVCYSSPEEKNKSVRSIYSKLEDTPIPLKKEDKKSIWAVDYNFNRYDPKNFVMIELQKPKKEGKTAKEKIKELQEKEYPNKLTLNIFNGDIKPITFYNHFNTTKEVSDYLSSIAYTSYTIFNGDKKIAYGTNHKQINMNRLVEEELERQEQKVFQDWDSRIDNIIDAFAEAGKRGDTIRRKPSGILGIEEVTKIMSEGKKESKIVEKAPVFTYCKQMKNAIEALSLRSLYGHKKYEKGNDWENFSRVENGEFEYSNAAFRHALGIGEDSERDHLIAEAWNSVAKLELFLRNN